VRRRLRLSPSGRGPNDPWFHIGTLEVTTAMAVVLLSVVGIVVWATAGSPVTGVLLLDPRSVLHGQVWRLVTWPFAYLGLSFWDALTIFFFWYFGTEIERELLGRVRFTKFLLWSTIWLGVLFVGLYAALPGLYFGLLTSLDNLQLMVLLLWIAQWPTRRFLFNIPAWLFGAVIVGISVLQYVGYNLWGLLLHFLVGTFVCALIARHYGALSEAHWLPKAHLPKHQPRQKRSKRSFDRGRPTVVAGPWESATPEPRVTPDEARMNALLDKIHASGQDSLTDRERAELLELRERLRRR
jgi:hypothetical protein